MDYHLMFKGDHIQAVEFQGKTPTLTIKSVTLVQLEDEKKKTAKEKGVAYFRETKKGWVLNRTNAESLAAMFGPETDAWVGKRVKLQAVDVQFGNEQVPGIRVVGSPDISKPITFTLKLPRKRPRQVTLQATGGKNGKAAPPPPPPEEEPPPPAPDEPEMDEADIPF